MIRLSVGDEKIPNRGVSPPRIPIIPVNEILVESSSSSSPIQSAPTEAGVKNYVGPGIQVSSAEVRGQLREVIRLQKPIPRNIIECLKSDGNVKSLLARICAGDETTITLDALGIIAPRNSSHYTGIIDLARSAYDEGEILGYPKQITINTADDFLCVPHSGRRKRMLAFAKVTVPGPCTQSERDRIVKLSQTLLRGTVNPFYAELFKRLQRSNGEKDVLIKQIGWKDLIVVDPEFRRLGIAVLLDFATLYQLYIKSKPETMPIILVKITSYGDYNTASHALHKKTGVAEVCLIKRQIKGNPKPKFQMIGEYPFFRCVCQHFPDRQLSFSEFVQEYCSSLKNGEIPSFQLDA